MPFQCVGHYRYGPYERYYAVHHGPHFAQITRSNQEVEDDVKTALNLDSWVDASKVTVQANNGVVNLTGTVDSAVAKRAAGDDAWDTPGVYDVVNNLQIQQTKH